VLIHRRTCRLTVAVCAPSMSLSQAGCPRPVQWLLMCAVASALLGGAWGAVSENGGLRQGSAATRAATAAAAR
jgi:hypothetical protein